MMEAAMRYTYFGLRPNMRFVRKSRSLLYYLTPFGHLTYEDAKSQLEDPSKRERVRACLRIVQEYELNLQQRFELEVVQNRGHPFDSGFSYTVSRGFLVPILMANAAGSRRAYEAIKNKSYLTDLSPSEFEKQYPNTYDAVATLERIATSTHPELRRIAREAILDADVLLRLATNTQYKDTAVYAATVLGWYVREASHWIDYYKTLRNSSKIPFHLFACSGYGFLYRAKEIPLGNRYHKELSAMIHLVNDAQVLNAFFGSLYGHERHSDNRSRLMKLLTPEDIQNLLERVPDLTLAKQLEKAVRRCIEDWDDGCESRVKAIIDGLNTTEEGKKILKLIGKRLNALFNRGVRVSRAISAVRHAAYEARYPVPVGAEYGSGGWEGFAPDPYGGTYQRD